MKIFLAALLMIGATLVIADGLNKSVPNATQNVETSMQGQYQKPADDVLRKKLSSIQYAVTQNDSTETPFKNAYWDNKKAGIYVDVVSGEPLFSSKEKFKSGTGWPSFYKPLDENNVVTRSDNILFYKRTELRSKNGDSHLGHVFEDGPKPTGLRYCINSASLKFIPVEKLKAEGYGQYVNHFQASNK